MAVFTLCLPHRVAEVPQTGQRLAQQGHRHDRGELLMHPVQMTTRPLITLEPPYLTPLQAWQLFAGLAQLGLGLLSCLKSAIRTKPRQRRGDPLSRPVRLHRFIEEPLSLSPSPPSL